MAPALALLALAVLRCVAAQDTSGFSRREEGNAAGAAAADNPARPVVRLGDGVPGVQCTESAAGLAPPLAATLEPDVATGQRSPGRLEPACAPAPFFAGVRCFPNCEYPNGTCPHAGVCLANTSCVLWRVGKYAPQPPAPLPQPCIAVDANGTFDAAGAWVPAPGGLCSPAVYSPAQAYAALRGRHIAFGGDSLIRQIYLRLVAHLRGFTAVVDRTFHAPALYLRNASHDRIYVGFAPQAGEPASASPPPLPRRARVAADEVLLTFDWAPSHNEAHADGQPFTTPVEELLAGDAALLPPVVVYGIIYWRAGASLDDELPLLRDLAARSSRLFWVTTPEEPGPAVERNAEFAARNAAMRAWAAAQTPPGRVRVLPLDAMAAAAKANAGLRPGGKHFACGVRDGRGAAMGAYSHAFAPMLDDSGHMGADCRDVVDLALAQLLLNAMQD